MDFVTFRLGQYLNGINNEKIRKKQEIEWQKRYQKWGLNENTPISFTDQDLRKIILAEGFSPENADEESAKELVKWAERLAAIFLSHDLTTSQFRNIFGELRRIGRGKFSDTSIRARVYLLIPKLEYAAGKKKEVEGLKNVMVPAIKMLAGEEKNFLRFLEFFEAILAYHKAYGGK